MTKVLAAITTSVDGYVAGPHDGPGKGLGDGGERLHYWVFGGPWSYESGPRGEPAGEDAAWLAAAIERVGAVVGGRWTYEAAGHWGGDKNGVVEWKEFFSALENLTELESFHYLKNNKGDYLINKNGEKLYTFHTPEAFVLGEPTRKAKGLEVAIEKGKDLVRSGAFQNQLPAKRRSEQLERPPLGIG